MRGRGLAEYEGSWTRGNLTPNLTPATSTACVLRKLRMRIAVREALPREPCRHVDGCRREDGQLLYAHVMPRVQPEAAERFMGLVFAEFGDDEGVRL
jgi:hypothetical protein